MAYTTQHTHGDVSSFEDELLQALLVDHAEGQSTRDSSGDVPLTKKRSFQRPLLSKNREKRQHGGSKNDMDINAGVKTPVGNKEATAATTAPPQESALRLTDLPLDCLERIVSRVSPNDLCCICQMCRLLDRIASSQSLWKALYHMRWPSGNEVLENLGDKVSWKALYLKQDAEDIERGNTIGDGQDQLYLHMARAFREQTLTQEQSAKTLCFTSNSDMCIPGSILEHVERFKTAHGINNIGSKEHMCEYVRLIRHHWICRCCGAVHACGEECAEIVKYAGDDMMVCRLTGCCSREMISADHTTKVEDGHNDMNHEEAGMGGRLGRAFFAGYNAADGKEMMQRFGVSLED